MPDAPDAAPAADAPDPSNAGDDAGDKGEGADGALPGGLPADDPNGEGTTPEEVAAIMKSSGIKLPAEAPAVDADADADDDQEEGDPAAAADDDEEEDGAAGDADADAADDEDADKPDKPAPAKDDKPTDAPAAEDKYFVEAEDANGVTFKIPLGAKMEDILADFVPKNNGQIMDILAQLNTLQAEKKIDDEHQALADSKEVMDKKVADIRSGWDSEIKDLTAQKRIPEGADGEKRTQEVYKFMNETNAARMKAGKPTIGSFEDGLDKLERQEARAAEVAQAKKDKDEARAKGGLVGGSSAPASTAAPVYRAGTARNANEAIRKMNLIEK